MFQRPGPGDRSSGTCGFQQMIVCVPTGPLLLLKHTGHKKQMPSASASVASVRQVRSEVIFKNLGSRSVNFTS